MSNIAYKAPREMKGDIKIVDNVFVKMIPLKGIGDRVQGHAHNYDHITLLSCGKVLMKHDNGEAEYTAPVLIVTPKGIMHEFVNLEEYSVLSCIHAIRDGDGFDDVASPDITEQEALDLFHKYPVIENAPKFG